MPLDPQVQALLDTYAAAGRSVVLSPGPFREGMRAQIELTGPGPDVARVDDRAIPGPDGDLAVRIYWPEGDGPFPVLVWFHGGGWVIGDLDTTDHLARSCTVKAKAIVVSVDYRLAPEHPYPAAVEDAIAAVSWVADHAAELGGDRTRVAVGGDSAGGNVAAVAALEARRRGGPDLCFQLLLYPVIDAVRSLPSYVENADGYSLTAAIMEWFCEQYVGDGDPTDPRVSPLYTPTEDLVGLPPALVITAEFDVLRDEGEAYARRLQEAGVPVTLTRYDGQIHGFAAMARILDGGKAAVDEAAEALRQAFG